MANRSEKKAGKTVKPLNVKKGDAGKVKGGYAGRAEP
jgi:hypothetical protein